MREKSYININGRYYRITAAPDTPLLWVLRDELGLTDTKAGCGIGVCGSCTVHIDGVATRSCVTPVYAAVGKVVTTIEGLSRETGIPLQDAWIGPDAPHCDHCYPAQIMTAAALLAKNHNPTNADIDAALACRVSRCGTYQGIRRAIQMAAGRMREGVHA